jgi:hypothetical protein
MEYLLRSRVFSPHLDHERIHDYAKRADESVRPNQLNLSEKEKYHEEAKSVAVIGGGCDRNRSNLDGSEAARLLFRCGLFCRLLRLLIWLNEEPETRF